MSVCSLTEASVQADGLITPLHHTTPAYCLTVGLAQMKEFFVFAGKTETDYIFGALELVYMLLQSVCVGGGEISPLSVQA